MCRIMRLIAVRHHSLRERVCIFVWIQKCTKKITATRDDPQGAPVKKRPDACLLSAQRMTLRAPEISQTRWRSDMRNFGRFAFSRRLVCCFSLVRGAPFPTHRERSEDARSGRQGPLPDGFGPGPGLQAQQDQKHATQDSHPESSCSVHPQWARSASANSGGERPQAGS